MNGFFVGWGGMFIEPKGEFLIGKLQNNSCMYVYFLSPEFVSLFFLSDTDQNGIKYFEVCKRQKKEGKTNKRKQRMRKGISLD